MDFVDEEDLAIAQIGKDGGEVAFDLQRRAGSLLEGGAEFVGDNVGERCFAEARRAVEKDVVEGFASGLRGLDGYVQIFFDFILADEFLQALWAEL
jgi:hypothetical protein